MSFHEEWLEGLKKFKDIQKSKGANIQLPPPSMLELKIEYLEAVPGKHIKGKVPFQARFTNPIGTYQGGMLSAAMDDHLGPLAYITCGGPCTTISLNTTFLKAFTSDMSYCLVEAEVLKKTQSFVFLRATAKSPAGDILAHAESHVAILREDQLVKVK